MILFYGDPKNVWHPLLEAATREKPAAVIIAGDAELERPLAVEVEPLLSQGIRVLWIAGNGDGRSDACHENLFGSLPEGNLHRRVVEVAGLRVAGLGGVFRRGVWDPDGESPAEYRSSDDHVRALPPGDRWRGGLPRKHRVTIYPEDFEALGAERADVLVCHEAPRPHRHGIAAIGALAARMGARLVVHGHHHESYEDVIPGYGIRVIGLAKQQVLALGELPSVGKVDLLPAP